MGTLKGKKVVIIGGSYGMGFATAEMAVDAGAEVAIAARGADKLAKAATKLEWRGNRPVAWRALRVEDRPAVAAFLADCAPFDHLVLPGSTVNPVLYDDLTEEEAVAVYAQKGPMKRLGSIDEFGALCAFLCSRQAGYITGQAIVIDGGHMPTLL